MTVVDRPARPERLAWLDVARVLCALMILGIHWLRAASNVHAFGARDGVNLVMDYQGHVGGASALFRNALIAGTSPSLATWLTNLIGLLGGFGWEAVSALILISGFSLALSQRGKRLDVRGWVAWYGKRAKRILIPYYLVALPLLAACGVAWLVLQHRHGHVATVLEAKLLSQFATPLPGIITSHLLLFDPWGVQWAANFFAPAWWFVPAILLAYVLYPAVRAASRFGRGIPLLAGAAAVTVCGYALSDAGVLVNETWYYIVIQEAFNFCLGVVIAGAWMGAGRERLERIVSDPRAFVLAAVVFVIGNIANWTPAIRPVASMLYGPSLVVMVCFLGNVLAGRWLGRQMLRCDAYDLYLVHQPFAFPIALFAKIAFHAYGVFVGWFAFVAVAVAAARLLSAVQHLTVAPPKWRLLGVVIRRSAGRAARGLIVLAALAAGGLIVSSCGPGSTASAQGNASPPEVAHRTGFLGAFFRPEGNPPYGVFSIDHIQRDPEPYPSPSATLYGPHGYCDAVADNGVSISSGHVVDPDKLAHIVDLNVAWTRSGPSPFFDDVSHIYSVGRYRFGDFDSAQCALNKHHIVMTVTLDAGPVQYNVVPGQFSPKGVSHYKTPADFAQWCGVIVNHERRVFPAVYRYTLPGNEVNSNAKLFPGGDEEIAAYSQACYRAVKAANPKAFVYGFELNMDARADAPGFVRRMVALGCKVGTCYDGLSAHLGLKYPIPPANAPCYPNPGGTSSMQCLVDLQTAAQAPVHFLIGETVFVVPGSVPDEATKALATVAEFAAFSREPFIDGANYANVDECDLYPSGYFVGGCLIDSLGNELPAYTALQKIAKADF